MKLKISLPVHAVLRFLVLATMALSWASTPSAHAESAAATPKVVCTTGMITDVVRTIAEDTAVVSGIMGEGVDPHLYKPTRGDMIQLKTADVVFYNGLFLEGKMVDIIENLPAATTKVVAVSDPLLKMKGYLQESGHAQFDPHIWMDVTAWIEATKVIEASLSAYAPRHAKQYALRSKQYQEKLNLLHKYATEVIQSIPKQQRVLVTAHDAFSYFGRAYDIEVRGIQGISTESEAGIRDIEELISFIVERKISSVFVETSVAQKNVQALLEGAKAKKHELSIGGTLFSDSMGKPGTYEGTYIGMIDHNVTAIGQALGASKQIKGGFRSFVKSSEGKS